MLGQPSRSPALPPPPPLLSGAKARPGHRPRSPALVPARRVAEVKGRELEVSARGQASPQAGQRAGAGLSILRPVCPSGLEARGAAGLAGQHSEAKSD